MLVVGAGLEAIASDPPVAFWKLGEPSGTVAADVIGTNAGTYVNTPTLGSPGSPVSPDTAVGFNGIDEYVSLPNGLAAVLEGDAWTIECYALGNPSVAANSYIVAFGSSANGTPIVGIQIENGALKRYAGFWRKNDGTTVTLSSNIPGNGAAWHHVAFVRDSTKHRIYVDGVERTWTSKPALGPTGLDRAAIGALSRSVLTNYFASTVDEVAIFNYAVSAAAIAQHASSGVPVPPPVIVPPTPPSNPTAPTSFINALLASNRAIDSISASSVSDLTAQTVPGNPGVSFPPSLNVYGFTATVNILADAYPTSPVRLANSSTATDVVALKNIMAAGVPVITGYEPAQDPHDPTIFWDGEYACWQPGLNRSWEIYKLQWNTDTGYSTTHPTKPGTPKADWATYKFTASWGGRTSNLSTNPGHPVDRLDGDQNSPGPTYERKGWNSTATSLPLVGLTILETDVSAGVINHAIAIAVASAKGGFRWPAQRTDGSGATPLVSEGMRYRLPFGHVPNPAHHPICQMIEAAVRDYGMVVRDKSSGGITVGAEPGVAHYLNGTPSYAVLNGFPWSSLQLLTVGSDADPNP
jgi:hypothetical protein